MKSKQRKIVLAYHMEESVSESLTLALKPLGIPVRRISEEGEKVPVGFAAGMPLGRPGAPLQGAGPLTEAMIVMSGLSERELDQVLGAIRREMLPIDLKAVLTPVNSSWNARVLQQALCREREALKKK